jgi:hypothetical protein
MGTVSQPTAGVAIRLRSLEPSMTEVKKLPTGKALGAELGLNPRSSSP